MRIYHFNNIYIATLRINNDKGQFIAGKLLKGKTRLEVITKALAELSLYQKGFLTI